MTIMLAVKIGVKQKSVFEWSSILELCHWAVNQSREIPGLSHEDYLDADPDWGWARQSIAALLADGFDEGPGCIPIEHRSIVWDILLARKAYLGRRSEFIISIFIQSTTKIKRPWD
jgi:hypothetical protein